MSITRVKQVRRGAKNGAGDDGGFLTPRPTVRAWDWEKDVAVHPDGSFTIYAPTAKYALQALIVHGKFGKGVVVEVEPQRATVLFQDGQKKLAHGLV